MKVKIEISDYSEFFSKAGTMDHDPSQTNPKDNELVIFAENESAMLDMVASAWVKIKRPNAVGLFPSFLHPRADPIAYLSPEQTESLLFEYRHLAPPRLYTKDGLPRNQMIGKHVISDDGSVALIFGASTAMAHFAFLADIDLERYPRISATHDGRIVVKIDTSFSSFVFDVYPEDKQTAAAFTQCLELGREMALITPLTFDSYEWLKSDQDEITEKLAEEMHYWVFNESEYDDEDNRENDSNGATIIPFH